MIMNFKKLFCYAARTGNIPNGASETQNINFANDYDFELREIRTNGTSGVLISLSYATGENISNIAINTSFVGNGQNALKLFEPVLIPRNSQITVTWANSSGGAVIQEIQFWGYKVNG